MSLTFTKLFASITESTVWCESDQTRLVWITMLAMADRLGRVFGSIPGLANRARVPTEAARTAIALFLSPDIDSRTKDHEGRRIEEIDGGWRLLNHEKYRSIRDEEAILESKRKYINTRRAKEKAAVENVDSCRANAEAYTEAEAIKPKSIAASRRTPKSQIKDDFKPSDAVIAWAAQRGIKDLSVHAAHFVLTCNANGYQYVNWDSAFMKAIKDNWAKVEVPAQATPRKPDKYDLANIEFNQRYGAKT